MLIVSQYETIGRRADMGDSDYVSPISSKCLSIAVLFGGLVFAVVLASLVYHLLSVYFRLCRPILPPNLFFFQVQEMGEKG